MRKMFRIFLSILLLSVLFSCCVDEEIDYSFPKFDSIEVTDSTYLFFNYGRDSQFLAVDTSTDKIVKRYPLDEDKNYTCNFIYVKEQKKCYFTYLGNINSIDSADIMEFDPATASIKKSAM